MDLNCAQNDNTEKGKNVKFRVKLHTKMKKKTIENCLKVNRTLLTAPRG